MTQEKTTDTKIQDSATPWPGDVLARQKTAEFLTTYLTSRFTSRAGEDKGFVIAIDAEWGFGKTFLLNRWKEDLIAARHPTVYFDAWQNDHSPEPLLGFIAEIHRVFSGIFTVRSEARSQWKGGLKHFKKLIRPAGVVLAEVAAKRIANLSVEELKEFANGASESVDKQPNAPSTEESAENLNAAMSKLFDIALKEHTQKNEAIRGFRERLELLVDQIAKDNVLQLPVMVLVDELDRCRPSYAIELLEGIKHLFGVRGIYFVVALNVAQLSESIKAVYGGGFHARGYLKRFFDAEYSLPTPDSFSFAKHLFGPSFAPTNTTLFSGLPQDVYGNTDLLPRLWSIYANAFSATLRDQQQALHALEASVASINAKCIHMPHLVFLVFLRQKHAEIFDAVTSDADLNFDSFNTRVQRVLTSGAAIEYYEDEHYGGRSHLTARTRITLVRFAWMYFEASQKNSVQLSHEVSNDVNRHTFPKSVLAKLAEEAPYQFDRREFYALSIRSYPELVKQAGHLFSK
jgi:hypothetical protein